MNVNCYQVFHQNLFIPDDLLLTMLATIPSDVVRNQMPSQCDGIIGLRFQNYYGIVSKMKMMNLPLIALVFSNLVPLVGVSFFGWSLLEVMFIYWMENVIVGIWNVVKMLTAKRSPNDSTGAILFVVCFFIVHYGMFCAVHGVFVFALFGSRFQENGLEFGAYSLSLGAIIGVIALALSHGVSYFVNYIGKGEYKRPQNLFSAPYGRMIVLHVTLVLSGGIIMILQQPIFALVLLVILKIIFDAKAHLKSHRIVQSKLECE